MPLLQSHYSSFITTTHDSATVLRIGTLALTGFPLERLPLHRSDSFPSSTPAPVIYCHATSMPDVARPELRYLSDLSRGIVETPVLTSFTFIDTSSMVHFRSSQ